MSTPKKARPVKRPSITKAVKATNKATDAAKKNRLKPGKKKLKAATGEDVVLQACTACFQSQANQNACNKFVNCVVTTCKNTAAFPATYLADDIVGALTSYPWQGITPGDSASAVAQAAMGNLVIGGLTGGELGDSHGHVVIIHSKTRPSDGVPYGSWGTDSAYINAEDNHPISECFKKALLPQMHYGYLVLGTKAKRRKATPQRPPKRNRRRTTPTAKKRHV